MKSIFTKNQIYVPFLIIASVSFILGIIFAYHIKINFIIFYLLALIILAFLVFLKKRQKVSSILVIFLFFFIGLLHQTNFNALRSNDIYYLSGNKSKKVRLKGVVASNVQKGPFDNSFVFHPTAISVGNFSTKVSGRVYVRFTKRWLDLRFGDHLGIPGRLKVLKNEGYFNKRLIRQGIRSTLYVGRKDWITIEETRSFSLNRLAFNIKEALRERFNNISPPARDFLVAFILGDRSGLSKEIYSVFRYTGTVHILAISGLHIGIIIFILLVFLKSLRLKLKPRFIITILFLIFYCFMTGLRASVVRAVIMSIILLLSFIVERQYHVYNSLAAAAMIILGIWPWQVFDLGFQLSFISVLSIIFLYPKVSSFLPKIKNRFLSFVEISFSVSLSAWLGAAPLVSYYFGIVSFISVIANVFLVALMPFIIAGGFIYLFMSYLVPILTEWVAVSLEFMINILLFIAVCFKKVPFAYFYVDRFPVYILFGYYGLALILFNILLLKRKRP